VSEIDTYAKLISRVRQWLGDNSTPGFATAIEVAVQLAEQDMNTGFLEMTGMSACKGLRVPEMVKRVSFAIDEKYEVLPADFLEAFAIYRLDATGTEFPLGRVLEDRAGLLDRRRGTPRYYCISGQQFRIVPRPENENPRLRMIYYARVSPLTEGVDCTPILAAYPSLYLYGTLAHMEGWLMNDPRIPQWKTLFHSAIKGANRAAMSRGGPLAA
jgi:hypothetical protein